MVVQQAYIKLTLFSSPVSCCKNSGPGLDGTRTKSWWQVLMRYQLPLSFYDKHSSGHKAAKTTNQLGLQDHKFYVHWGKVNMAG